jgi:DNA polymerase III delta prime subunit
MNHYDRLWVEKYRPKNLLDIVLEDKIKNDFLSLKSDIPHLFFYGRSGTGKTSLSKIIIEDVLKCQYLYINASDESGIDTIRTKVINFSKTKSIDGQKKVIFLDEADGMSSSAMRILRNIMEEYAETTRFILTANYFEKIIEPIRSRCVVYNLQPPLKGYVKRCVDILKKENVKIPDLEELVSFIKERYPDFRRTVNDLQRSSINGSLELKSNNTALVFSEKIWKLIKTKTNSLNIRKIVIENEGAFDNDYQFLYRNLFDTIYNDTTITDIIKKEVLFNLGEFCYRDNTVIDHEINFYCFLFESEKIFH